MTARFVCRPLEIPDNEKEFYAKELGTCIPLGTWEAYQDTDLNALELVSTFLVNTPPFLTAAYYELQDIPLRPRQQVEPLVVHKEKWIQHVSTLTGPDNICFVSNWFLEPQDVLRLLHGKYKGEVIRRGTHDKIPVLLEWTPELCSLDHASRPRFSDIWTFGTWAYVVPKTARNLVRLWASSTTASEELVREFFTVIDLMFWVKFDLDGIWVMSHKASSEAICQRLCRP